MNISVLSKADQKNFKNSLKSDIIIVTLPTTETQIANDEMKKL